MVINCFANCQQPGPVCSLDSLRRFTLLPQQRELCAIDQPICYPICYPICLLTHYATKSEYQNRARSVKHELLEGEQLVDLVRKLYVRPEDAVQVALRHRVAFLALHALQVPVRLQKPVRPELCLE